MKDPQCWLADNQLPSELRDVLSAAGGPPELPLELYQQLGRLAEQLVVGGVAAGTAAAGAGATGIGVEGVGTAGSGAAGIGAAGAAAATATAGSGHGFGALLVSFGGSGIATKSIIAVSLAGAVAATAYVSMDTRHTEPGGRAVPAMSGASGARLVATASNRESVAAKVEVSEPSPNVQLARAGALRSGPKASNAGSASAASLEPSRPGSRVSERDPIGSGAGLDHALPTQAPPEAAFGDPTLLDEARVLEKARSALAADPALALGLATDHQRYYPAGQLSAERELIAVDALLRLDRRAEAIRRAEPTLKRAPGSLYAKRLRRLLGRPPQAHE